jgi:hypothetical protein
MLAGLGALVGVMRHDKKIENCKIELTSHRILQLMIPFCNALSGYRDTLTTIVVRETGALDNCYNTTFKQVHGDILESDGT